MSGGQQLFLLPHKCHGDNNHKKFLSNYRPSNKAYNEITAARLFAISHETKRQGSEKIETRDILIHKC